MTVFSGSGLGTGFAFAAGDDGGSIVVTNFHVVEKGRSQPFRTVQVHVGDERLAAHPYRWDADLDIALLDVEAQMPILESAYFGDVPPTVGDPVLAFGSRRSPDTATVGIISAIRSTWLQTDAQISHGNSGEPLLDRDGQVLGITSLGVGRGSGLGFAIDIRQVCELDAPSRANRRRDPSRLTGRRRSSAEAGGPIRPGSVRRSVVAAPPHRRGRPSGSTTVR